MSSTHLELLGKNRLVAFKALKTFKNEGTLAGGTALSLQIEHRHSFDFDIFLEREIKRKDLLKLKSALEIKTVEFSGINITLLHYYYLPLFEKVLSPSLPLYSVKDIALDKILPLAVEPFGGIMLTCFLF